MGDVIAETEKALVGAMLLSEKKLHEVLEVVKIEDFATVSGAKSFGLIADLWMKKRKIDIISVANGDPSLIEYLAGSTSGAYAPAALEYAWAISKAGRSRRIKNGLTKIISGPAKPELMLEDLLALYQREMATGKKSPDIGSVLNRFDNHVSGNLQKGSMGFQTGFRFLHDLYVQYVPGHIWSVGGYTSVGKTAVMIQKICNLIVRDKSPSILVISTEMTEEQVIARIIANLSGIHAYRILSGKFRDQDEEGTAERYKSLLKGVKLAIYDDVYTLGDIEAAFRKADLRGGVDIGFIDYVQNVRLPETKSQYQEQSEIAKRLQSLAKDVRATIICLSQLSNSVARGDTDQFELKGSGEWAAVSDVGVILERHKTEKHRLRYTIKKNRHGALGEQELEYKMDFTKLVEKEANHG